MSDALRLLGVVLPRDGYRCLFAMGGGRVLVQWSSTNETLVAQTQAAVERGEDVYFSTATFVESNRRVSSNVLARRTFHFDLDVGPDKPYLDTRSAIEAAYTFGRDHLGSVPSMVISGAGVHAYWSCTEDMSGSDWLCTASALRAFAEARGIVDRDGVCVDVVRVLRLPGTRNFKTDPPLPVKLVYLAEPIARERLIAAIGDTVKPARAAPRGPVDNGFFGTTQTEFPPASAARAAEHCAQLAHMRDQRGNVPEPFWYAVLGVVAQCEDADTIAHEWSDGHPNYDPAETDAKLAQARAAADATTCARFAALRSESCGGCPHKGLLKSPIVLGRETVSLPPPSELPKLPWGFRWGPKGQIFFAPDNPTDPDAKPTLVSAHPVYVVRTSFSERGTDSSAVLRLHLPHRAPKDVILSLSDLVGREVRKTLAREGLLITARAEIYFQRYIAEAVHILQEKGAYSMSYQQFGFKPAREILPENITSFVAGHAQIDRQGAVSAADLDAKARDAADSFRVRGTPQGWKDAVRNYAGSSFYPLQFAIVASMASPLMRFKGARGSTIIHMRGPSGKGKSVSLITAASVWGDPEYTKVTDNDTENSRFAKLARLDGLPTFREEFAVRERGPIRREIMYYTEGKERARNNPDGSEQLRSQAWANIVITASNHPLLAVLGHGTSDNAPAMRVFEYQFDLGAHRSAKEQSALIEAVSRNCGVVGVELYRYIMPRLEKTVGSIERLIPFYTERCHAEQQHRYYIRLLAVCHVAAHVSYRLGLSPFDPDALMSWATAEMTRQIKDSAFEAVSAIDAVNQFLTEHHDNTLISATAFKQGSRIGTFPVRENRDTLHIRADVDTGLVYIDRQFFRSWLVSQNLSPHEVEHTLAVEKVLVAERRVTLGAGYEKQMTSGQQIKALVLKACQLVSENQLYATDQTEPLVRALPELQKPLSA